MAKPASQADGDFGYLNQPGPSKPAAFVDAQTSAKGFINNGRISAADLERLVPRGTPNTFKSSATITDGSKFQYEWNGQNMEIKMACSGCERSYEVSWLKCWVGLDRSNKNRK